MACRAAWLCVQNDMSQADLITQLISLCSSDSATRLRVYALYDHADNACRHVEDAAFLQGVPSGKHALHQLAHLQSNQLS